MFKSAVAYGRLHRAKQTQVTNKVKAEAAAAGVPSEHHGAWAEFWRNVQVAGKLKVVHAEANMKAWAAYLSALTGKAATPADTTLAPAEDPAAIAEAAGEGAALTPAEAGADAAAPAAELEAPAAELEVATGTEIPADAPVAVEVAPEVEVPVANLEVAPVTPVFTEDPISEALVAEHVEATPVVQ